MNGHGWPWSHMAMASLDWPWPAMANHGRPTMAGPGFSISGCAAWNLRKQNFQNALAELPCTDTVARDTFAIWALGLEGTPRMGLKDGLQTRIVALFDQGGCPEAVKLNLGNGTRICEETS